MSRNGFRRGARRTTSSGTPPRGDRAVDGAAEVEAGAVAAGFFAPRQPGAHGFRQAGRAAHALRRSRRGRRACADRCATASRRGWRLRGARGRPPARGHRRRLVCTCAEAIGAPADSAPGMGAAGWVTAGPLRPIPARRASCRGRANRRRRLRRSAPIRSGGRRAGHEGRLADRSARRPSGPAKSVSASCASRVPTMKPFWRSVREEAGEAAADGGADRAPRSFWDRLHCQPARATSRSVTSRVTRRGPRSSSARRTASRTPCRARRACSSPRGPTSAAAQSSVSAMPGSFRSSSLRTLSMSRATCSASAASMPGTRREQDGAPRIDVGIVDVVVEAAAAQRVGELARAVGGEHHARDGDRARPCRARGWRPGSPRAAPAGRPRTPRRRGRPRRSAAPAARGWRMAASSGRSSR